MNNSISNNIRNTEFRGNQAQQGSAIFLNTGEFSEAVYNVHRHALCMVHRLQVCSQACTFEA